jgi:hypothetical protein
MKLQLKRRLFDSTEDILAESLDVVTMLTQKTSTSSLAMDIPLGSLY